MDNKSGKPSISIFFPCYNDAGTIGELVKTAFQVLKKISADFEVIVIDDGSTDNSREILKKLTRYNRRLKLVFHDQNKGYGGALQSGFALASKDLIFYTDGDAQYDVKELPILLSLMRDDVDVVNGIKMERQDYRYRVILGNAYAMAMRWFFLLPIWDVDCDFRLIRKKTLEKIRLRCNSGAICVELVKKLQSAGARFRQVSVYHYNRTYGQSQFFRPMRILKTFIELANLWCRLLLRI